MEKQAVLEALQKQVVCYRTLSKLADQQHEHVRQSRTEELLSVLSQRQQVLDEVAQLEQSIGPAKRRWNDYLSELGEEDKTLAQQLMAESRQLLEQITAADRNDALVLQQRKIEVGRMLRHNAAARQVNRSYAAASVPRRPASMDIQR